MGRPESETLGSRDGCNWWFFDEGIMLDIDGELVLRRDGKSHDARGWKALLDSLLKNRPQRPIDGVVLTIPATELIGSEKSEADRSINAGEKSAQLFDRLYQDFHRGFYHPGWKINYSSCLYIEYCLLNRHAKPSDVRAYNFKEISRDRFLHNL